MNRLILASKSPRRCELMQKLCDDFEVIASDAEEILPDMISPFEAPVYLAALKAKDISSRYPGRTVIGADTVVICDDRILGKPKDKDEAFSMLRSLSGKTHTVVTGVCITDGERQRCFSNHTRVTFYELYDEEIRAYIASKEPMDKAGAYGIQEKGALFVREIEGDFFNVVGLPVAKLSRELKAFSQT